MSLDISKSANVTAALESRVTVRAFLDKPVPEDMLTALFETAQRTPSGGNLQPWHVHVMTGDKLAAFTKDAVERAQAGERNEPTHPPYPSPLWEPQRSWRYKLGEDMYGLLGIEKDNKMARLMWLMQNIKFFEAPVGIIITGDKRLETPQYLDIGIYLQSLMLLAREAGLHSAPQGWWRNWHKVCHDHLDIADEDEVLVGMSLGYADPSAKVNSLRADRADMADAVKFYS
ncbi:MAG: nitroreductase [Robiginitomaculum sp.]